ncbi:MAG: transglycosylase, partial [Pseudomonadota bacterium]
MASPRDAMLGDPISFDELPGWDNDDHPAAMRAFHKSARVMLEQPARTRASGVDGKALQDIARWLEELDEGILGHEIKAFFESHFIP